LNKRKEESKSSFSFLLVTLFFSFSKRKEKGGKKKLEEKFGYTDLCFQRPILNQLDIIAACATIAITMASQSQSDAKLIYLVKIW
jgi:hypothetical protein